MNCERDGCSNPKKSPRAKWCSDPACARVRVRGRVRKTRSSTKTKTTKTRSTKTGDVPEPTDEGHVDWVFAGGVFSATLTTLTAAKRVDTPAGQNALALATRIDHGATDTGSSIAALSKQHLAAMAEALRDAEATKTDSVDELRRRREARGA